MAVVLEQAPGAVAAGTDAPMARLSFPIKKWRDTGTVNPVDGTPDIEIFGSVTDGTIDSDLQIVDPVASERWIKSWFETKANIRLGHDPKRPVGKGLHAVKHEVRALIAEPVAKHLVRTGVLNDYSVGICHPGIVPCGDPRFRHLDPMGKALGGYITDHPDGLTELGEISIVDRGSNYGTAFQIAKSAGNGSYELTGTLTAPQSVLNKVAVPKTYKTVSVDLPADMAIKFTPGMLAKMNTMAARNAVAQAGLTKVAEPDVPKAVTDADPPELVAIKAIEATVYKRDIDTATRRRLRGMGRALANLSYPIETHGDADNAVTLALSGHGNVAAAKKLIRRIARKEGWTDILDRLGGKKKDGKRPKADKVIGVADAAAEKVAVCDACKDTGAVDDQPCTVCPEGAKAAAAIAALEKATSIEPEVTKKAKVMCGHCGAKQSRKHQMCSECGQSLHSAMPVLKNHDYDCLGCGREDLDKGEKYCPGCGKENPGYLEAADHKIPANKAAKERVDTTGDVTSRKQRLRAGTEAQSTTRERVDTTDVTKAKGGKGKKSKKGKKMPFGGNQAKPFGKPVADGDDDAKDTKKSGQPAAVKGKKAGKKKGGMGRSPAQGAVTQQTMGLPPHREPDGAPVEALEADAGMSDGDMEVKAAMRHKATGADPAMAGLHDLTCPAFRPGDVAKAVPWASYAGIDEGVWQAKALEAASGGDMATAMARWNEMAGLGRAAVTLKTASPQVLLDIAMDDHAAFLAANKALTGATPGPGSYPTPGHAMPGQFKRPYITAGHAAPSPQHDAPHSFPAPAGTPVARDFGHGYLTAGHAMDSPANDTPRHEPVPSPSAAGEHQPVPYHDSMRDGTRHARAVVHDHIAGTYPDLCPMSPHPGDGQKPAPQVPPAVGGPVPGTHTGKASKAARAAEKARRAKKAARAQARKAATMRRKVERQVLKGALTVDAGRAKLGLEPFAIPETTPPILPVPADPQLTYAETVEAAVKAATTPLAKRLARQDKALRKQAKVLDAIASQPDTTSAPFRGAGVAKSTTATMAPAGPADMTSSAEQAQVAKYMRLLNEWRTTSIPENQEAAWQEMQAMLGTAPLTGHDNQMTPLRPNPHMRA